MKEKLKEKVLSKTSGNDFCFSKHVYFFKFMIFESKVRIYS